MARKSLLHRQQVIDYWREIGFEPVCEGGELLMRRGRWGTYILVGMPRTLRAEVSIGFYGADGLLREGCAAADSAEAYAVITRHLFEETLEYAKLVCEVTSGVKRSARGG